MLPFSALAVSEDRFQAGPAWKDAGTACSSAVKLIKHHVHIVKKWYRLSDGSRYLRKFKTKVSAAIGC